MPDATTLDVQQAVRDRYAAIASSVGRARASCCAPAPDSSVLCCDRSPAERDPISSDLYAAVETLDLPPEAIAASLGCGNPTALLPLEPGMIVLDLGSGGGLDVLLSARRVGPTGKAYGLDMTDEMLALARENQRKAGVTNAEFLKGTIEAIPLPDASVDVVISNCVINLSVDKDAVLHEAFRVLKPGGRFAVSDIVVGGEIPPEVRRRMDLWTGCIAGALDRQAYVSKLHHAGFEDVELDVQRVYAAAEIGAEGQFASAFIRARRPGRACCGPTCCT